MILHKERNARDHFAFNSVNEFLGNRSRTVRVCQIMYVIVCLSGLQTFLGGGVMIAGEKGDVLST